MFVGTGAAVFAVCPGAVEPAFAVDVPPDAPVDVAVVAGALGNLPQREGDGAGAGCSISKPSSVSAAADADGAGAAAEGAGGGVGACVDAAGGGDAAGDGVGATSPSWLRMTNTPTAPTKSTIAAVIAATAPLDIFRELLTGTEIGDAALMLALTADVGA
jgi:hypothetical protein